MKKFIPVVSFLFLSISMIAQQLPEVKDFLGVKWGSVYKEQWFPGHDGGKGFLYGSPQLYKEMLKKGYHLEYMLGWNYDPNCLYYVGSYAGDAYAKINFFFVNNKFYSSAIYCFEDVGGIENKYENIEKLMIDKFGQPTDRAAYFTHDSHSTIGPSTSCGVHWRGVNKHDNIDIYCTLMKDAKGNPIAVYISFQDQDLYTRETTKF